MKKVLKLINRAFPLVMVLALASSYVVGILVFENYASPHVAKATTYYSDIQIEGQGDEAQMGCYNPSPCAPHYQQLDEYPGPDDDTSSLVQTYHHHTQHESAVVHAEDLGTDPGATMIQVYVVIRAVLPNGGDRVGGYIKMDDGNTSYGAVAYRSSMYYYTYECLVSNPYGHAWTWNEVRSIAQIGAQVYHGDYYSPPRLSQVFLRVYFSTDVAYLYPSSDVQKEWVSCYISPCNNHYVAVDEPYNDWDTLWLGTGSTINTDIYTATNQGDPEAVLHPTKVLVYYRIYGGAGWWYKPGLKLGGNTVLGSKTYGHADSIYDTYYQDFTSSRPGGGNWTWDDLMDVQIVAQAGADGGYHGRSTQTYIYVEYYQEEPPPEPTPTPTPTPMPTPTPTPTPTPEPTPTPTPTPTPYPTSTPTPSPGEGWDVRTLDPQNVTNTGATLRGEILEEGEGTMRFRGFRFGTDPNLNTYDEYGKDGEFGEGIFSESVDDLITDTIYYYRAVVYTYLPDSSVLGNIVNFMTTQQEYQQEGNGTEFLPPLPPEPGGWIKPVYGEEGGKTCSGLPGCGVINGLAESADIPKGFVWTNLMIAQIAIAGVLATRFTKLFPFVWAVLGILLGIWIAGNCLDWWVMFPYIVVGLYLWTREQPYAWG